MAQQISPEVLQAFRQHEALFGGSQAFVRDGIAYQTDNTTGEIYAYPFTQGGTPTGTAVQVYSPDGASTRQTATKEVGSFGKDLATFALTAAAMAYGIPLMQGAGFSSAALAGAAEGAAAAGGAGAAGSGAAAGSVAGDAFLPGALGIGGSEVAAGALIPGLEAYALPAAAGAAGGAAGASAGPSGGAMMGPPTSAPALTGFDQYLAPTARSGTNALSSIMGGNSSWSSLAGPLASMAGGAMGSSAARDASAAQVQAAREAAALQEPFRQGGVAGLNRLTDLLGISGRPGAEGYGSAAKDFSMADFEADPGYDFRQSEGLKALERTAASRGGLLSGQAGKAALRFSQGLASDEYGRAFDRFQVNRANKLNPLQSLMGAGQTSANTIGGYTSQAGDAQAAGRVGSANAWSNALGQGVSAYQNNELMNRLLRNY